MALGERTHLPRMCALLGGPYFASFFPSQEWPDSKCSIGYEGVGVAGPVGSVRNNLPDPSRFGKRTALDADEAHGCIVAKRDDAGRDMGGKGRVGCGGEAAAREEEVKIEICIAAVWLVGSRYYPEWADARCCCCFALPHPEEASDG